MNAMLRRKRSRGVEQAPPAAAATQTERERLYSVVCTAREKLRDYLALEDRQLTWFMNGSMSSKLGSFDGIGAHIKIASTELADDGSVSDVGVAQFQRDGLALTEAVQSSLLNYAVLLSLLLTVYVSLIALHATRGYEVDGPSANEVLLGRTAYERSIYTDVATFAWPDDEVAQRNLRRAFHWIEL